MDYLDLDLLIEDTLVVGVQHHIENCRDFYEAAMEAASFDLLEEHIGIRLQRDPGNAFDSYAIKVLGKWIQPDGRKKSALLGYLSKGMAWKVGQETDEEDRLYGEFCSIEPHPDYGYDLRINVYVKYDFQ
ncbi:MAG: hypothetical protein M9955_04550 [Rhizobiaceae bacterium]|jgi:hypothetical protein|nr:hypothetical protein [Rhizobiaceae bacterium]